MLLSLYPSFTFMSSSSPSPTNKPRKPSSNPNPNSPLPCRHSPSATLDILILILVLFSCTFLITSYFSYIFQSLSLILPPIFLSLSLTFHQNPLPFLLLFVLVFAVSVLAIEICCNYRSRKCENPNCKGLKNAMEFDIQIQTEESLRSVNSEIDGLPWKGGSEGNPDYECLRSELRRMAPQSGRALLLFRARCGCPIAKLEAWGQKKGRRHKKKL
ncbi:uncharacterized protein At5g19025-like isoform X2 [Tasmannia lanceolata]|uniref:uncharacterized protein At5g19025-like isoform X2 n=1 Tax=Tasmannia lanceolata TaxID=3420 RepID=UPI0040649FEC